MIERLANKPIVGLLIVALLIIISVPFQIKIDNIRGKFRSIEDSLYISSSSLKKVSLGYDELLSDIYWMRALQYFGGRKLHEQDPELLYHYFDIITDLDPNFVNAYRYGGTFLAEPPPYGLGDFSKGFEMFEKGRKNNPNNFRLPLEQAFLYYFYLKDYEKAAELFKEASEKPGLSPMRKASMEGMAASAHSQGGNNELSREIWEIIYKTSPSEGRRKFARTNLDILDTIEMEEKLTEALDVYMNKNGELPADLKELQTAGVIKYIPEAPVGGEFIVVPKINKVKNTELVEQKNKDNLAFLNSKSHRFQSLNGRYPNDADELKDYLTQNTTSKFPEHPTGDEYSYDPETGLFSVETDTE